MKTRNATGWGYEEEVLTKKERGNVLQNIASRFDLSKLEERPGPIADAVQLSAQRLAIPPELADVITPAPRERLLHAVGRSFRDLAMLREVPTLQAPDVVAYPESVTDLARIAEWCYKNGYAIIPFGGGSSVVGGVNPEGMAAYPGIVTVDLQKMNRVKAIITEDRIVHAEAGILGPDLDAALKPHGMHVRHTPQSYHHSTLGGWIVTRGAGHNSTAHAKIEDKVESIGGLLSDGRTFETRPLPATSVAIDPRSYWTGSEGMLGFITEARLRVYPLPKHRGFRGIAFPSFQAALAAARAIVQSDLFPVQLRILDEDENDQTARLAGGNPTGKALMILADENVYPVIDERLQFFEKIAAEGGGVKDENASKILRTWVTQFYRQPYVRDFLMNYGMIVDTFETSIPWHRAVEFYREVKEATRAALAAECGPSHVGCRVTHVYTDGPSLYFSFYGPGKHGRLVEQWERVKAAASKAVIAGGGTISHHHAMGRDHKAYAKDEFPAIHLEAVRAIKRDLDPKGLMNPGLWF